MAREDDTSDKVSARRRLAVLLLSPFPVLLALFLIVGFVAHYGQLSPGQGPEMLLAIPLECIALPAAIVGVVLCLTRWSSSRNRLINILIWVDIGIPILLLTYVLVTALWFSPRVNH